MKRLTIVLLVFLVLSGCATTGKSSEEEFMQFSAQSMPSYGQALIDKDIEKWLSLHSADVIKMPQDRMPIIGIEALRKDVSGGMKAVDILEVETQAQETVVFDDYAYAWGYYTIESKLRDGDIRLPRFEGKYLTVFRKEQDGSWKIFRDIYSSNLPPERP